MIPLSDDEERAALIVAHRLRLYGRGRAHDEDDIAQAARLLILTDLRGSFDGRSPYRTYLTQTLRFRLIDWLRCQKPQGITGLGRGRGDPVRSVVADPPDRDTGHDQIDRMDTLAVRLRRARLRPLERAVVRLYFVDGWPWRRIGELFGFSESRACQVWLAARDKALSASA